MKHFLTRLAGSVAGSALIIQKAFALTPPPDIGGLSGETNLVSVITRVITWVLDFVLIIAVAYVVYAGIRLIMSGGDESAKDSAKKTIIYVVIGIIVVLLARVIVVVVNNFMTT